MEVSIHPLDRTLHAQAGDNLLDVLRANQVPISYSCMAGRCGTCRCKVLAGRTQASGPEDSRAPMAAGQSVLACQTTLVENCAIEIPELDEVVVQKRVRVAIPKPLDFSPGQYATLQFTPRHIRPYSMAVAHGAGELEFHIRLVPDGRVTSYVASELKVGDAIRVAGPLGTAYLRRKCEGPVVCIAGGTGLAPILSILRGMLDGGMRNEVHVYFGVRTHADLYGLEWLRELQARHAAMHLHVVVASAGDGNGYRGGVVTKAVADDWAQMQGWRAYLAGAPVMVDAASILLRQRGIDPDHIHADAFHASGV
ncbi:Oxidoreductase FAD-binding domain-containing protein [Cupriavidus basilensis OR16]|uniref:Oxidoreductase FAD-binding domain-containing protein n=1 Tax=Cupriavidus basilensis OR16 TaxID=1127483 RepID=H1S267_9BURK|nr:2Fe-2S iron-sulfur cluster-binding protein [Cupriavidus basilensis]EHP43433.1 Oxidoreductase FAD-binding domain-containing protein [Cupriavidus basilensis OR16]